MDLKLIRKKEILYLKKAVKWGIGVVVVGGIIGMFGNHNNSSQPAKTARNFNIY